MEVESAAYTVHAQVYTTAKDELDAIGDWRLRDNFHQNMLPLLAKRSFQPKRILDIGCSTGLSSLKLHESFPNAEIIGMDLSPYMLAGKYIDTRISSLTV
jgi:ubiquinone/menaquinone biosynthesis C-methylase UbiE